MKSAQKFLSASFAFIAILSTVFTSCKNDDPPLPDNPAVFESAVLGVGEGDADLDIKIRLTRATDKDIPLTLSYVAEGVTEGTDFTLTPASASGVVSLTILKGASDVTFKLSKAEGALFDGDEKITFTIASVTSPIIIGEQKELVVSFSEILSAGATMDLDGGGATYPNKVFLDLSANTQTAVARTSWDLGFYMGSDFKVIVNSSTAMMARAIDKNDLTAVTAADTTGFAGAMSISAFNPDAVAWIDDPTGGLTDLAFDDVSSTATENKVYIINRGNGPGSPAPHLGWKKVRVLQNGSGYTIQYADIAATTFSQIQITKDDLYLFKYISFDNGAVNAEPAKAKWDIAWTYFTNIIPNGPSNIPYGFQDVVIQNRSAVQTAKVLTSDVTYEAFTASNLASLEFFSDQLAIGSDWRVTSPPPASVYTDRFYIILDADGNYYKLKFTALLKDGVRGTPSVEFELVKKGV